MTVTNGSAKTNGSSNGASSYPPLKDTKLFAPLELGKVKLEHRVVLAPLTRLRGVKVSDGIYKPSDLHVEYYAQRASKGGLLLTEATEIYHRVSTAGRPGEASNLTTTSLAGIPGALEFTIPRNLPRGKRSQTPCTQKAATSSASFGTPAALLLLPFWPASHQ